MDQQGLHNMAAYVPLAPRVSTEEVDGLGWCSKVALAGSWATHIRLGQHLTSQDSAVQLK